MLKIETMVLPLHIIGPFLILIPLVHFAPHSTAKDVFATFKTSRGWSSDGLSFFVVLIRY